MGIYLSQIPQSTGASGLGLSHGRGMDRDAALWLWSAGILDLGEGTVTTTTVTRASRTAQPVHSPANSLLLPWY